MDATAPPVTLFLPTHNRPDYLRRALDYYALQGNPLEILICDSSLRPYTETMDQGRVRYLHCPGEAYLAKLRGGMSQVGTKYVVMGADDDFVVPRAVRECLRFLEDHPDHSSAQGKYVSFSRQRGIRFRSSYVGNYAMAVQSPSPADRLREQFDPYMHQFYALHRTENLRDALCGTEGWGHNGILIELIVAMMAAINGRHKILDIFYSAKEEIPDSAGSTFRGIGEIATLPRYRGEYLHFLTMVARRLADRTPMSGEEALRHVEGAMNTYFQVFLPRYLGSPGLRRLKTAVRKALPSRIRPGVLEGYRRGLDLLTGAAREFDRYFDRFDPESRAELDLIRKMVLDHEVGVHG